MFPVIYLKDPNYDTVYCWRLAKPETPDDNAEWTCTSADKREISVSELWSEPHSGLVPITEAEFLVMYKAAQEKQLQERTLCIVQQTENAKQAERLTETTL